MKKFLTALFCLLLMGAVYSAPPDPSESDEEAIVIEDLEEMEDFEVPEPEVLDAIDEVLEDFKNIEGLDSSILRDLEKKLLKLEKKYKGMEKVLKGIEEGYEIDELILEGDSIFIRLNNDSSFTFRYSKSLDRVGGTKNDIIRFGSTITIEEGEVIEGDVVAAFGDVIVNGTVEGGVIAFSGDIYISSTGKVENGVLALSGKVKTEPGAYIGAYTWGTRYDRTGFVDYNRSVYRSMGLILLIIYIIWIILTATCASLLKSNVKTVMQSVRRNGIFKSFFMGYLAYCLALVLFIGLNITILGIPLAILGVPLMLLAANVLSSTTLNILLGFKILNTEQYTFKAFLYGSMFLGLIPGLLFFVQAITGNLAIMVFSWIVIGLFIFILLPVGLGAVLSTRFGTRLGKSPASETAAE
ncbi:MAG: hypothetical protein JSU85_00350 [Candidatus Zixiibacteriota bacterium]|nr:MAG: hypothetical protein JSU85_00350 [candidate division Zixibacteria bacterium]